MKKLSVLLAGTLICAACSAEPDNSLPPVPEKPPEAAKAPRGPTGRIRGVVRAQGKLPAAVFDAINENQSVCGEKVSLPRLQLGKDNGVQHAFVYLDNVKSTEAYQARESLLVDQEKCQYVPHALIVPAGTKLEVTNSDPILHNVHGTQVTDQGPQTVFNIAQPVRGQHTVINSELKTPGIVHLTCQAGHPWMSGYVFVADHPFVSLTNEAGEFVLEGVPPGTYRIKMWHEGVTLKSNNKALQRYSYEDPYEVTQDVVVRANGESVVNFDMSLRPGKT
jgi:plastocyanin